MKRTILLAAALLCSTSAWAVSIEGDDAFACYDLSYQRRIDTVAGSGDKEAVVKLVQLGLDTRKCAALPAGLKVRIEENSFPYACVAKLGNTGPCLWVRQRNVNVKGG